MKKIYVPAGETMSLSELHTELVIVHGTLKVTGQLTAKRIEGKGIVEADEISCDSLCVHPAIAEVVDSVKIAVRKLLVESVHADEIIVTDYLATPYLLARRVSMTLSDVKECVADEIIALPPKKRGMLRMLFAAWWRSLWLPNKLPEKTAKQPDGNSNQPTKEPAVSEEPAISEDFLDALIDRLEERGFVYDAPYAEPSPLPFAKEQVA